MMLYDVCNEILVLGNGFGQILSLVVCDESGQTKFPFLCLAHVTLLTLAQARLRICSGFAQDCSSLLRPSTIFGALLNCFNSNRVGPELVSYIKIAKISPILKIDNLFFTFSIFSYYLPVAAYTLTGLHARPVQGCCGKLCPTACSAEALESPVTEPTN